MSYRSLILSVFTLIIGLGTTTVAMANPTCTCDEICTRVEERCLNQGGSVSQCADAYDNCFIMCGDTWPCPPTDGTYPNPRFVNANSDALVLEIPFWMTTKKDLAAHVEAADEASHKIEETDATLQLD